MACLSGGLEWLPARCRMSSPHVGTALESPCDDVEAVEGGIVYESTSGRHHTPARSAPGAV